jgi:hypothetical protein
MMKNLIFTACMSAVALGSKTQRYPGLQFRFNQNFFDAVEGAVFSELAPIISLVESYVPTQYTWGDFEITNVKFDYPVVDLTTAAVTIDNTNNGIFTKLPNIKSHTVHIDFDYTFYYIFSFGGGIEFSFEDFQVESGLAVSGDVDTGAVQMQPYSTAIDFGSTNIKFTDNIILEGLSYVLDWLRTPAIWVIDWYL